MRRAYFDQSILVDDRSQPVGICLGYDHAGEHERGIGQLQEAFGIPAQPSHQFFGADARTIRRVPAELLRAGSDNRMYLMYTPNFRMMDASAFTAKSFDRLIDAGGPQEKMVTAWDQKSFGIRIWPDKDAVLQQLFRAFAKRDIMIFLNGAKPFGGSGLMICICSTMPTDVLEQMRISDLDYLDLRKAADATGIEAKLKAAGKLFFALSPRWADKKKSAVVFWLNPMDQENNNDGWFTVNQLERWIQGKGQIPKKPQRISS